MVTAGFRSWTRFKADDGIVQRLRVAFIDAGMPTGKSQIALLVAASLRRESGEVVGRRHFDHRVWMPWAAEWQSLSDVLVCFQDRQHFRPHWYMARGLRIAYDVHSMTGTAVCRSVESYQNH